MRRNWLTIIAVCIAWTPGCGDKKGPELSATYITAEDWREDLGEHKAAMTGSAMVRDLSLSEHHFVPHQAALSTLGEERLLRYIDLLDEHGGTLRVEGRNAEESFMQARVSSVVNFLSANGVQHHRIAATPGLRAGYGIAAVEAIEVKKQAYEPGRNLTDLTTGGSGGTMGTN